MPWAFELLLQIPGECNSCLDVLWLCRLVAAGEQDDELSTFFGEVDAVPRTEVDLQLGYALSEIAMFPGIAVNEPINAHLNASATCAVFESVDPVSIDLGHLHTHVRSVAYEIRLSSVLPSHDPRIIADEVPDVAFRIAARITASSIVFVLDGYDDRGARRNGFCVVAIDFRNDD